MTILSSWSAFSSVSAFDLIFHPVAWPFNFDYIGLVEDPVQNGRGEDAVVVEDFRPLLEGPVCGNNE